MRICMKHISQLVNCRIGSLEMQLDAEEKEAIVNCRIGSLEISYENQL